MILRRLLIISLLFSFTFSTVGCRNMVIKHKRRKDARQIEKEKRKKEAEAQAKYEEKVAYQASIQTPETRKRMKAQYKKSEKYHSHRKEFFLKRWWNNIFGGNKRTKKRGNG